MSQNGRQYRSHSVFDKILLSVGHKYVEVGYGTGSVINWPSGSIIQDCGSGSVGNIYGSGTLSGIKRFVFFNSSIIVSTIKLELVYRDCY